MEMSPRWSRAHDWKSCRGQKPLKSSNLFISATKSRNFVPGFFCYMRKIAIKDIVFGEAADRFIANQKGKGNAPATIFRAHILILKKS